ncbi:hypothetical protein I3F58_11365 [Streptomyces sp. MUM 203J]|uniref:hypothetical protein n=1 Tax=Streptomyces sp. MUM 203J TaxID=2791990 RepID=UPI001F03D914|nr:hypothetical protein [Streptomyces sp. MUM 203J]MCH0540158.1 hypothetical protein [Streptomyces sp. MUM 203J]
MPADFGVAAATRGAPNRALKKSPPIFAPTTTDDSRSVTGYRLAVRREDQRLTISPEAKPTAWAACTAVRRASG